MRVTANTYSNSLVQQLNTLALRQNRLQAQAASGQRLSLPEDDPAAVHRVLDLQSQTSAVRQYQDNISRQRQTATATYGALKSLKTISDRAGEIATLADGLKSPEELQAYANEVGQLLHQALGIANSQFDGSYLFAGTRSDSVPFTANYDVAQNIVSVSYQGNSSVAVSEISEGVTLATRVPGANSSGNGPRGLFQDTASGADFFGHLVALQQHLAAGDVSSIASSDRAQLESDENNLLFHVTHNGCVQARLEAADSVLSDRATALNSRVSSEVDADLAQTLVQFNAAQNAYQAALQSGAGLFDLSLLTYLR
jgi:flagellar hook-associated protein 3 FlgL